MAPHSFTWDAYNAAQWGRPARPLLAVALRAVGPLPPADRVAVDLGCGEGVETAALLADRWTVHAVDGDPASLERLARRPDLDVSRLHLRHSAFEDLDSLPMARLVHAAWSLPYCPPAAFDNVWGLARASLAPGGVLAAQLFGPHDDLVGTPGMTFHTHQEARGLVDGLEVVHWHEEDADGTAFTGPKHWHVFHVVARRPAAP